MGDWTDYKIKQADNYERDLKKYRGAMAIGDQHHASRYLLRLEKNRNYSGYDVEKIDESFNQINLTRDMGGRMLMAPLAQLRGGFLPQAAFMPQGAYMPQQGFGVVEPTSHLSGIPGIRHLFGRRR